MLKSFADIIVEVNNCQKQKYFPSVKFKNKNYVEEKAYNPPLLTIAREENRVVKSFIKAIEKGGQDEANIYLCKHLRALGGLDFKDLQTFFHSNNNYENIFIENNGIYKKYRKNSLLVMDRKQKRQEAVVHLYMIKEPDKHSNWKICAIEKEI